MTTKSNQVLDEVKALQFKLLKIQYLQHLIKALEEVPADSPTDFKDVHQEIYGMCVEFFEDKILELAGKKKFTETQTGRTDIPKKPKTEVEDLDDKSFSERNKKFGGKIIRGLNDSGVMIEGTAIMLKEPNIVVETKQGTMLIHESRILDKEKY